MDLVPVYMPKYGMTMTEGTVIAWLRVEGDLVTEGEPLLSIETEKVQTEIEAPATGRLVEICVDEAMTAPVGTVLAYIQPEGSRDG